MAGLYASSRWRNQDQPQLLHLAISRGDATYPNSVRLDHPQSQGKAGQAGAKAGNEWALRIDVPKVHTLNLTVLLDSKL